VCAVLLLQFALTLAGRVARAVRATGTQRSQLHEPGAADRQKAIRQSYGGGLSASDAEVTAIDD
jgi:hypothetical protein